MISHLLTYFRSASWRRRDENWRQTSRSPIHFSNSLTSWRPVSRSSVSMYVPVGLPLVVWPCLGIHVTKWRAGEFSSLYTCPASLSLLLWMMLESFSASPYSSLFVILSFHDMFNTCRSILVYVPSKRFSSATVRDHVSLPYSRIDTTVARKSNNLIVLDRLLSRCYSSCWGPAMPLLF